MHSSLRLVALIALAALVSCDTSPLAAVQSDGGDDAADGGDEAPPIVDVTAPRPIAPVSVSYLTTRRPTLQWKLAPGSDGARVEVCSDRPCTQPVTTFDVAGDHGAPPVDLPPGPVFWRLHGMSSGAAGPTPSVTWELIVPAAAASVATTWGAVLDANGDGFGDIAVGDSDVFLATQHVYVYLGGPNGPASSPSSVLSAPAPATHYAASVASAGDVDGDGFADLLVGSPREDTVYLYRGSPSGYSDSAATVVGPAKTGFGTNVSAAGDVDADGYADVVVGAPLRPALPGSKVSGAALVYFGGPDGLSASRATELLPRTGSDAQSFGQYVSTAGDVDGDGRVDVAVWGGIESIDPQRIALYLGRDHPFGAAPSAELRYRGALASWLGNANLVACVGDTNGDGFSDIIVASPVPPGLPFETDHLSLFLGGPGGPPLVPTRRIDGPLTILDHFGVSVAGFDMNGDGLSDISVASVGYGKPQVAAVVYDGAPAGPTLALQVSATDPTAMEAREVGGGGDVDGDGYADLVIGYPSRTTLVGGDADGGGGDAGLLYGAVDVHRGGPRGVEPRPRWTLLPPDTSAIAYGASLARP
ncbi:MAG TPA: FG-GAP-like repeat-containing protein [Polyangiaceae bacterium]